MPNCFLFSITPPLEYWSTCVLTRAPSPALRSRFPAPPPRVHRDLQQSQSQCEQLSGPASELERALEQSGFLAEERDRLYALCKSLEAKMVEVRPPLRVCVRT